MNRRAPRTPAQRQFAPHLGQQVGVRLTDDLCRARTDRGQPARQRHAAAAKVHDPQPDAGWAPQNSHPQRLGDALHIFELEPQRILGIDPGLLGVAGANQEGTAHLTIGLDASVHRRVTIRPATTTSRRALLMAAPVAVSSLPESSGRRSGPPRAVPTRRPAVLPSRPSHQCRACGPPLGNKDRDRAPLSVPDPDAYSHPVAPTGSTGVEAGTPGPNGASRSDWTTPNRPEIARRPPDECRSGGVPG